MSLFSLCIDLLSEYRVLITTLVDGGTTMAITTVTNSVVIRNLQCDTSFFITVSAFAFDYSDRSNVTHFMTSKHVHSETPYKAKVA